MARMADLLLPSRSSSCENFWCREYSVKPRYIEDKSPIDYPDLVHSKSDDSILLNGSLTEPEIFHGLSDAALQIQKDTCTAYDNIVPCHRNSKLLSTYFSDSEMNNITEKCDIEPEIPTLKVNGCFNDIEGPSRRTSRYLDSSDRVDPEHSIREMIMKNDFYKFVLFKQHYDVYLDISQKYEEARTISYYLEEKYHEVKNQRDSLIESNKELEKKLEQKDQRLQEKEEELFQLIEKVFRLEEDCEKLRKEKEKIQELKERLEKDKNEIYEQLKLQAEESESKKLGFEKMRNDLIKQFTAVVSEKDNLEKENSELKQTVGDLEYKLPAVDGSRGRSMQKLQQQMSDLKLMAKQSATLNSQLKKGMKHLATCRRRKCSVCAYTRATFGDYSSKRHRANKSSTSGCFPFQFHEHSKRTNNDPFDLSSMEDSLLDESAKMAKRLSEYSFLSVQSYLPVTGVNSTAVAGTPPTHIPFIDECVSVNPSEVDEDDDDDEEMETEARKNSTYSSLVGHNFCSDSGFSSELCDSSLSRSKSNSFRRATKWTSSFRKLIRRVSSRKQPTDGI